MATCNEWMYTRSLLTIIVHRWSETASLTLLVLEFSVLTAFHTLSLLYFPVPHFQRPTQTVIIGLHNWRGEWVVEMLNVDIHAQNHTPTVPRHHAPLLSTSTGLCMFFSFFSLYAYIYISHLCYDVSVRLYVTEVHWRIIANLGFKFRSKFTAHCGRGEG